MSFRVFMAVLAVALVNVIFGLNWQPAPVPPAVATAPPVAVSAREATPARPVAVPAESSNAPVLPNGANGAHAPMAQAPPPPHCNVEACEAAYRSFRASDCTYLPTRGERRLCTKK